MALLGIVRVVLGVVGLICLLPTIFLVPALLTTAIVGAIKNNFSLLTKYLKIWGISLLVFLGVLAVYGIAAFAIAMSSRT